MTMWITIRTYVSTRSCNAIPQIKITGVHFVHMLNQKGWHEVSCSSRYV